MNKHLTYEEFFDEFQTYDLIYKNYFEQRKEIDRLNTIINNIHNYIEKMSYCEVVDNPKKELSRILERKNK